MTFGLQATTPTKIKKLNPTEILILWADGHETRHVAAVLRRMCPCATCRDEMTGERLVLPMHIPDNLEFAKIELVGQYALQFHFSDSHSTGIFSFEYLRELCRCEICAKTGVRTP